VNAAIELLQSVAGACHPLLFLKMGLSEWIPVGEEMLYAVVPGTDEKVSLVICDMDGNSKTMSDWLPAAEADRLAGVLKAKGLTEFEGEVKLPI
jgi:hypothetical protein